MKAYSPQIKVTLIKSAPRTGMSFIDTDPLGGSISTRFEPINSLANRYDDIAHRRIDLTRFFGDGGGVSTNKSIRDAAGNFTITLLDIMFSDFQAMESMYGLIEPMDMVEICFCHDAATMMTKTKTAGIPPVVMRGFISEVRRDEAIGQDGRPSRKIILSGQDSGKILEMFLIYYLNNISTAQYYLAGAFNFMQKYGEEFGIQQNANEFLQNIVSKVLNPFMALIVGPSQDAALRYGFVPITSIEGAVSPFVLSTFQNISLYQMLHSLLDVGVFNELYVEDRENVVALVLRPSPFLDVSGKPIQGAEIASVEISEDDMQSISVSRSDHGIANWFWVTNNHWNLISDQQNQLVAQTANSNTAEKWNYPNCAASKYGFRNMQETVSLGPTKVINDYGSGLENNQVGEESTAASWLESRRVLLGELNKDNVVFETGSMRIMGNENVRAGMYLNVSRNGVVVNKYYVVSVSHEFIPFQGFFTTVHFERGTGYINRATELSPYIAEWKRSGIK